MPGFHRSAYPQQQQQQAYGFPPTPAPSYIPLPQGYGSPSSSSTTTAAAYGANYIPLPAISVHLNSLLSTTAPHPWSWSVTQHIGYLYNHPSFPTHQLDEPATQPALPILIVQFPGYPQWQIPVYARNGVCVTVREAFEAIYAGVRTPVKEHEGRRALVSPEAVQQSFWARVNAMPDAKERQRETGKGVKRVDFLPYKRTRFVGIRPSRGGSSAPDVWELQVS